jgi:hypothetical protein
MIIKPQDLQLESWLVAAGRAMGPGSPLNIPIGPCSNFLRGSSRVYARGDGTVGWGALEEVIVP